MIIGIGTDLVEIDRVVKAAERESFLTRVYTEKERELIAQKAVRAATGFAAKEAVVKAMGCGFTGIRPMEIEILRNGAGQPMVRLHGNAKEKADALGIRHIALSLSDTETYAYAYALCEGEEREIEMLSAQAPPGPEKLAALCDCETERIPVLSAAGMKSVDQTTMEQDGIPSLTLMEHAAEAVTRCVLTYARPDSLVGVLCGTGNNGGDGLAVARQLAEQDIKVRVLLKDAAEWQTAPEGKKSTPEFLTQLRRLPTQNITIAELSETADCDILVDALFGIGLERDLTGEYAEAVSRIDCEKHTVIAVDIASGISADNGAVRGVALHATETVTFGSVKLGHLFYPGREYAGKITIAPIEFRPDLMWEKKTAWCYLNKKENKRPAYSNKGTFGRVSVIAGSKNMAGAAWFSAYAAYRTGAGLVKVITPEENRVILQTKLPEAMLTTYEAENPASIRKAVEEAVAFADALVIGPGLGTSVTAKGIVETALTLLREKGAKAPVSIWDADALNLLSEQATEKGLSTMEERLAELERSLPEHAILTPHPGELSRLTGVSTKELVKNLVQVAERMSADSHLIYVLKDAVSVVAGDGELFVQTAGNSGMATGGSGDVLTGVIAALAAGGRTPMQAATDGVYLHGLAGDLVAARLGESSVLARDIAAALYEIQKEQETLNGE